MNVNEKYLDKKIESLLLKKNTNQIQRLLGFKYEGRIYNEEGLISKEFLRCIMIKRDEIVYELKDIQRVDDLDYNDIAEEIEYDKENDIYNADMCDVDKITIIKGKGRNGQPYTFYYYGRKDENYFLRQIRLQTKDGTKKWTERRMCFVFNKYDNYTTEKYRVGLQYLDGLLLVTSKDKNGNKISALSQDDIMGCRYYEYDKNGNIILCVREDAVEHDVVVDGKKYKVMDGLIEPHFNRIFKEENSI